MANIGFILAAALLTYATRIAGFGLGDTQWAARGLGVVAAGVIGWRTRQLWASVAAGMAAFWLAGLFT